MQHFIETASAIVEMVTRREEQSTSDIQQALSSVNLRRQVMQEMGRLGGLKGGVARAKKLKPEERQEIARKAAISRWEKKH